MLPERSRLYRKYYHDLTPVQRREFLSGRYDSPEDAERRLQGFAESNTRRDALLGRRNQKTSGLEEAWRKVDRFLARAEEAARDPSADAARRASLLAECRGHLEALKRNEAGIKRVPYDESERRMLLERNNYYVSRLNAVQNLMSKSASPRR